MAENIKLKDLYNEEQSYTDIGTIAVPKTDGSGNTYYVQRPLINYTLQDPPTHELTDADADVFAWNAGDGTVLVGDVGNFLGSVTASAAGKTTHPIVTITVTKHLSGATINANGAALLVYLYEELSGTVLLDVLGETGNAGFTAQAGWGQLLLADSESREITGYAKINDPGAVTIGIEQPVGYQKADVFYSLLSEVTQEAQTVSVTENGEQTIVPTAGKSGIRKVALNVNVPQQELQEKSVTLTQNGTTEVTPDEGYDGMSKLTAIVNVAGGGGGVQPDWNQNDITAADFVKNRPGAFQVPAKDAVTITWDGVIGDKESVDVSAIVGRSATLVKVSDEVLYPPHVYNATLTMKYAGNDVPLDILQSSSDVTYLAEYGCTEIFGAYILSFSRDVSLFGMSFSSGTWFLKLNDANYAKQISTVASAPLDFDTGVYVPIDGRYVNFGVVEQYGLKLKIGVHSNVGSSIGATIGSGLTMDQDNGLAVGKYNSSYSKLFVVGKGISASSRSDAFSVDDDGNVEVGWQLEVGGGGIVLKSSTAGSTKKFKITVDDTGALTATEVTN